ncbi:hypothetical protein MTO96_007634 [Rhipicephalus appendiculatus]
MKRVIDSVSRCRGYAIAVWVNPGPVVKHSIRLSRLEIHSCASLDRAEEAVPVQYLAAMPPEIYSHAVFGFSESLDWSTLHFVKPIDDIRVCSACRVVARKSAFLACRHVLCEPCYERWRTRDSHVCFIDGDLSPQNEVYWMEFPEDKMMKYEVSCWNRENGCEIITDVSSIADHFHRDCAYHSACCPKCSSTVLRKDIIAHLQSQCANHVLRIKSTAPPKRGRAEGPARFSGGCSWHRIGISKRIPERCVAGDKSSKNHRKGRRKSRVPFEDSP